MRESSTARALVSLAVALGAIGVGWAQDVRVEAHVLDVRLDPARSHVEVQDRATLYVPMSATEAELRLHAGLEVSAIRVQHMRSVPWRSEELDGDPPRRAYRFPTPPGLRGRQIAIEVDYSGTIAEPIEEDGSAERSTGAITEDGVYLTHASLWYPQGSEGLSTFELTVRVPDPWRVATQGRLLAREVEEGVEVTHWKGESPVDGLSLLAGEFVVDEREHAGVRLATYFYAEEAELSGLFLDAAAAYLDRFVPLLGPYPYPAFSIVENFFTTGHGMPGFTALGRDVIRLGERALRPGYLDHELVHCWWGNSVFVDTDRGNWAEGLTSYLTNYLTLEEAEPERARDFRARASAQYTSRIPADRDYALRLFTHREEPYDGVIGYGKGAMLFHLVRRTIGDERFFAALREVASEHAGRQVGWEVFEGAFDSGNGVVRGLMGQWLDRAGIPEVELDELAVTGDEEAGFVLSGVLVQGKEPYTLLVPMIVELADGELVIFDATAVGRRSPWSVAFDARPTALQLDPDHELMRRLDADSLAATLESTRRRDDLVVSWAASAPEELAAEYRRRAESLAARVEVEARPDSDPELPPPDTGSWLFLGTADQSPVAAALVSTAPGPELGALAELSTGQAALASWRVAGTERRVTLFGAHDVEAARAVAPLGFYAWDTRAVFDGGRSRDRLTVWPAPSIPLPTATDAGVQN